MGFGYFNFVGGFVSVIPFLLMDTLDRLPDLFTQTHTHALTHARTHARTHIHTYTHTHAHTHSHTYTHARAHTPHARASHSRLRAFSQLFPPFCFRVGSRLRDMAMNRKKYVLLLLLPFLYLLLISFLRNISSGTIFLSVVYLFSFFLSQGF